MFTGSVWTSLLVLSYGNIDMCPKLWAKYFQHNYTYNHSLLCLPLFIFLFCTTCISCYAHYTLYYYYYYYYHYYYYYYYYYYYTSTTTNTKWINTYATIILMPVAEGRKHTSLYTAGKRALSLCILLHANALLPAKRKYVNALLQGARRIIHNSMLAYSYL